MILGTGVDIVDIERFRRINERLKDRFIARVFTPGEQEFCLKRRDPVPHFAARFAAKEALFKALGTGWAKGGCGGAERGAGRAGAGAPRGSAETEPGSGNGADSPQPVALGPVGGRDGDFREINGYSKRSRLCSLFGFFRSSMVRSSPSRLCSDLEL